MIKEIELTRLVYQNSWDYWVTYDCNCTTNYIKWLKHEYKITLHERMTSFSSFSRSIEGDEKDVTFFLLRFS